MEEGKIATAGTVGATESPSMYISVCYLGVTLLLAWGRDQFQLLLVNQPVVY
jgi:hypothetical protein